MKRIKPRKDLVKPKKLKRIKPKRTANELTLLRGHVKAYHNCFEPEWYECMSAHTLLAYAHPHDRSEFAKKLNLNYY